MATDAALIDARDSIEAALDHLDDVEQQSTATIVAVGALTVSRLAIQTKLAATEDEA